MLNPEITRLFGSSEDINKLATIIETDDMDELINNLVDLQIKTIRAVCEKYIEDPGQLKTAGLIALILGLLIIPAASIEGLDEATVKGIQEDLRKNVTQK